MALLVDKAHSLLMSPKDGNINIVINHNKISQCLTYKNIDLVKVNSDRTEETWFSNVVRKHTFSF